MSQRPNLRVVKCAPDTAEVTPALLLAIYASTLKLSANVAQLTEQGRWLLFASVANPIATSLLVVGLFLQK